MDINDIKHLAVERIFLVPDASEGQLGYVWCDDPAPGEGMDQSEAVEYVRKDVHEARIAELEEREQALAAHVEQVRRLADSDRVDDEFYDEDGDLRTGNGWKSKLGRDLHDVLRKAPATSLDRRDAMMRAQGITDAASRWPPDSATRSRLLELAEDARLIGEQC